MRIGSHIPIKVDVGDEGEIALAVKRLTYEESTKLRSKWKAAENAKEEEKDELWGELLLDVMRRYVRLDCELVVECADGDVEIRKGENASKLLDYFGGKAATLNEIFFSLLAQNSLDALKKKGFLRPIASKRSSPAPEKEAHGPKPETAAESAESADSAGSGDATKEASGPSGSTDPPTDPSSSTNARSLN